MNDQLDIEKELKALGYKLTRQRKVILKVLMEHKNHFLSAEEIYIHAKKLYPQTHFSTIYRNLELLETLHFIHKTHIKNSMYHYGIIRKTSHHHHIICKICGKTQSIDFCPLDEILSKIHLEGFTFTDHKFELYGYCTQCQIRHLSKK